MIVRTIENNTFLRFVCVLSVFVIALILPNNNGNYVPLFFTNGVVDELEDIVQMLIDSYLQRHRCTVVCSVQEHAFARGNILER